MSQGQRERRLRGIPASRHIAIGKIAFLERRESAPPRRLSPEEVPVELSRFAAAVKASDAQLAALQERFAEDHAGDTSLILAAHRMIIQDPLLIEGTRTRISQELLPAEWALRRTLSEIRRAFESASDEYLRERKSDVDFAGERILQNLAGDSGAWVEELTENIIVIARDLSPADTAALQGSRVIGFATES